MGGINGNIIGLKINGTFVSCEVSSTINLNKENLPATAVDSGGWKEFISGIKDWYVSVNGNLLLESVGADIKTILSNSYFNDLPIFLQFSTRPTSLDELILSGAALFQSGNITAGIGTANWTASFQGTGELTPTFLNYALLINAMPPAANYPIIVNQNVI